MTASKDFRKYFSKKMLNKIYKDEIRYKSARGVDRINNEAFEDQIKENIEIIHRKVHNGTYQFSQYREKLISRGAGRTPRVISIPTIRDKLTQKAITEILQLSFGSQTPFLHKIINDVIQAYRSGLYQSVLRLDVKDFYPSIQHKLLLKEISRKIKKKELLHLIGNAVSRKTVSKPSGKDKKLSTVGVPQGLSISNILANIYLLKIDKKYSNIPDIKYFRYVDDILIFCQTANVDQIRVEITNDCTTLGLNLHSDLDNPSKSSVTSTVDRFTYLGYQFENAKITVRRKSIDSFRESIIRLLTNYKYSETQNIVFLKWALDLRITGCIFNKSKYGWLFFFSQIDDVSLLGSLDHFVRSQLKRFNINDLKPKTFLKSYYEITRNLSKTTYIPNFDKFTVEKKHQILREVFQFPNPLMSTAEIEYHFRRKIYKTVRELEKDLSRPS